MTKLGKGQTNKDNLCSKGQLVFHCNHH